MSDQEPKTVAEKLDAAKTGGLRAGVPVVTAPQRSFTVEAETPGYRLYATPAGRYTAVFHLSVWVLTTPGLEVGRYPTIELVEAALEADVQRRMWV